MQLMFLRYQGKAVNLQEKFLLTSHVYEVAKLDNSSLLNG